MKQKALCEPKDTKDMIDLMKYVEQAQQKTLIKLKEDIKVYNCSLLLLTLPFVNFHIELKLLSRR